VLGVQQQAQQGGVREPLPQGAVEVVGDGARGECGTGYVVRCDPGERGPGRFERRLLLLAEGEVHGLSFRRIRFPDGASR